MAAAGEKSVLVIGGTGAVGRAAVSALKAAGMRVVIGTRSPTADAVDGCATVKIDIEDPASVASAFAPTGDGAALYDHIVS